MLKTQLTNKETLLTKCKQLPNQVLNMKTNEGFSLLKCYNYSFGLNSF